MPRTISRLSLLAVGLAWALSACSLPAPASPTRQDQSAAYTAAAQTVIAELTQASVATAPGVTPASPTAPAPSPTPPPAASPTPPSPSPTETAAPTETATPSPPTATSAPPGDPRLGLGDPDFRDPFEDGLNWALYEDDHVSFDVVDGALHMTAFNPDFWEGWMLSRPTLQDFYLEMTATQQDCSTLDRYGLVARAVRVDQEYLGYFFGVTCEGLYSLRRWNGERFVALIDWSASDRLQAGSGQTNRIGLMAEGNNLSLYANGELLDEISDDTFEEGRFGVFVGAASTEDYSVEVEEIAYWELP